MVFLFALNHIKRTGGLEQRGHASYCVLPLEFKLVDSQSLSILQLFNLFLFLIVASDLLIDDHLHAPTGRMT